MYTGFPVSLTLLGRLVVEVASDAVRFAVKRPSGACRQAHAASWPLAPPLPPPPPSPPTEGTDHRVGRPCTPVLPRRRHAVLLPPPTPQPLHRVSATQLSARARHERVRVSAGRRDVRRRVRRHVRGSGLIVEDLDHRPDENDIVDGHRH